ncbi:hypothetical protein [Kitasatospora purpeofusca]|uniref:Uncharacterized protein n=1 Tax=Kitasatospora purpeofusca TaxID=67352 RepID=A0ABZ1TU22_9ACTN|nr:hypothetical protein [Kitasatospora purpeofusca]
MVVGTDGSTAFPVVAGPRTTWGRVTGTLCFDRAETRKAIFGTASLVAVVVGVPLPDRVKAAIGGYLAGAVDRADVARNSGKCLKLKTIPPSMIVPQVCGDSDNDYCA